MIHLHDIQNIATRNPIKEVDRKGGGGESTNMMINEHDEYAFF